MKKQKSLVTRYKSLVTRYKFYVSVVKRIVTITNRDEDKPILKKEKTLVKSLPTLKCMHPGTRPTTSHLLPSRASSRIPWWRGSCPTSPAWRGTSS